MAVACVSALGRQDPASADQRWLFYETTGVTRAIGGVDGGTVVDGVYGFYAEKTTSLATCAWTQIAYTGSNGWETWEQDCENGGGGHSSHRAVGATVVFARVCLFFFGGGAVACGPTQVVLDDGTPA